MTGEKLHMKTAYYNGIVYTGEWPLQEAFLVEDGVFSKTGADAGILGSLGPDEAKVDLAGRFVCAGFIDSHMHLSIAGPEMLYKVVLHDLDNEEDYLKRIKEYVDSHPEMEKYGK